MIDNSSSALAGRGLAWTPDSAADVAKLRGAPTARTPAEADQPRTAVFEIHSRIENRENRQAAGNSHAASQVMLPAAPDSGTTAGSGKLPTPTHHLRASDKENLRLNLLNQIPSPSPGIQL